MGGIDLHVSLPDVADWPIRETFLRAACRIEAELHVPVHCFFRQSDALAATDESANVDVPSSPE